MAYSILATPNLCEQNSLLQIKYVQIFTPSTFFLAAGRLGECQTMQDIVTAFYFVSLC